MQVKITPEIKNIIFSYRRFNNPWIFPFLHEKISGEGEVSQLVEQLGEQVDTLEDLTFGEDLQPTESTTTTEFDRSMCPLNTCCNPPADPVVPTFSSNFSVK